MQNQRSNHPSLTVGISVAYYLDNVSSSLVGVHHLGRFL